jgi:hypothetical protein
MAEMRRAVTLKRQVLVVLALAAAFALIGCSEEVSISPSRPVHGPGWVDPGPEDYHGATVMRVGSYSCLRCHGEDLEGGVSGYACSKCHAESPIE